MKLHELIEELSMLAREDLTGKVLLDDVYVETFFDSTRRQRLVEEVQVIGLPDDKEIVVIRSFITK